MTNDIMARLNPQARELLERMQAGQQTSPSSPEAQAQQARQSYRKTIPLAGEPEPVQRVFDHEIPGRDRSVPIRIYVPYEAPFLPVVVWCHGGGFITGDFDTHDAPLRALCNRSGCLVVSVGYRLAPESPWPAATEDCYAAAKWIAEHGAEIGANGTRIALGGDSAGGDLAAVVCLMARDRGGPTICYQVLLYPDTDLTESHPSWREFATAIKPINSIDFKRMANPMYLPPGVAPTNPYVSPFHAPDLSNLPPALIVTAEIDPQRDEGEAYAARLEASGVLVEQTRYSGTMHGFWQMAGALDAGKQALDQVGFALRTALQP